MSRTNKLAGLAALFAAGAVVGMLYAPDKGGRTRRKITRKSRRLFNAVDDTVQDTRDAISELRDQLKEDLERVNDEMQRLSKGISS